MPDPTPSKGALDYGREAVGLVSDLLGLGKEGYQFYDELTHGIERRKQLEQQADRDWHDAKIRQYYSGSQPYSGGSAGGSRGIRPQNSGFRTPSKLNLKPSKKSLKKKKSKKRKSKKR